MTDAAADAHGPIAVEGARKSRSKLTGTRIRWAIAVLLIVFSVVAGRLVQLGLVDTSPTLSGEQRDAITATRPALLDRNGLELAVDIRVPSMFAEPRRIIDVDEAVEAILTELPDMDRAWLRNRLDGDRGFAWIRRELTPAQAERIFQLGIPGIDFVTESQRFYPGGPDAAHILGAVNIDNQGIAGIERHIDGSHVALLQELGLARDRALEPIHLSIDLRVQHELREQLVDAMERYQAIAAAGVIMDVRTGEIVAMSSLPDFDPNHPATALEPVDGRTDARINRITAGSFELGSTFKTITFAAALDSGAVRITDSFDARQGVRFGRFTITDFHGQYRIMTVPEIYRYSSNIGTIKIMQAMGKDAFRAFLTRAGFDDPLPIELPETRRSYIPANFSEVGAATASFGHGLATTPMHMVAAMGSLVNGGMYYPPTLFPRTEAEAQAMGRRVISERTSDQMRYLMRLNGVEGTGSRMNRIAAGYRAGGKTGTAEKVVDGRYSSGKSLAIFASAFPMDDPRYAIVILVDEPSAENPQSGRTAGWNAGEVTGRLISRIAPMLGVHPDFSEGLDLGLLPPELRGR